MNYQKIYDAIIEKAKSEKRIKLKKDDLNYVYYENHHILPVCLKGTNEDLNLVLLTAREHYICHKILTYIYKENRSIACAFHKMTYCKNGDHIKSSRDYAYAIELIRVTPVSEETRERLSKAGKGKTKSDEWRKKIGEGNKGKIISDEQKETLRKSRIGKKASKETREKLSELGKGRKASEKCKAALLKAVIGRKKSKEELEKISRKGSKHSKETKINMSKNRTGIIRGSYKKIKCEYCGREIIPGNYKKWHGINCKYK